MCKMAKETEGFLDLAHDEEHVELVIMESTKSARLCLRLAFLATFCLWFELLELSARRNLWVPSFAGLPAKQTPPSQASHEDGLVRP